MADNKENSYLSILKRTSAFGGVQIFNILMALVRGKFVAMFLGPSGMGVSSLFTASQNTLQQFAGLGLNLALVKEVAAEKDNREKLAQIYAVAFRLILLTSLLGGALCFLLSPLLSLWAFGNAGYTAGFMLLSVSVALTIAGMAYLALLQGIGAVKRLAIASIVGGITGLCVGVPLYYFWSAKGIVPGMIALSAAIFIFYYLSFKQVELKEKVRFSWQEHKPLVKRLLSTGIILMIGTLIGTLTGYLINAYVRWTGSVQDVGLYQAANSVTNQYVGIVFSALALDYFPRLSAGAEDCEAFNTIVNRQIEVVSLIITPLVIGLMLTAPLLIKILLTADFIPIVPLMRWMGYGMLIQAMYFPLGYIFIVKNNRRLYLKIEVIFSSLLWIACAAWFYYRYSLLGLGVGFFVSSLVSDIVGMLVIIRYYGLKISAVTRRCVLLSLALGTAAFAATAVDGCPWPVFAVLLAVSLAYSGWTLRKRL